MLAGGVAGGWILWEIGDSWREAVVAGLIVGVTWGFLVGLIALAVRVLSEFEHTSALIEVRPLLGPLSLGAEDWAVEPTFIRAVLDEIQGRQPALVVECGSGISTVLIGARLSALGAGRLVTFEHEAEFGAKTESLLVARGLRGGVDLCVAPLRLHPLGGEEGQVPWYDGLDDVDLSPGIEILVVDGPPASLAPMARYPAVPLLRQWLSRSAVIFLHDGARPDERETARRWAAELGGRLSYIQSSKGGWMIRLG
jgi:hypothetical protein